MDNAEIQKRMRQNRFVRNNGMVIRAINSLRFKYVNLVDLADGLSESMSESELIDCINYLSRSGYLELRCKRSHEVKFLSDADFEELEALVLPKGVQLLNGKITDPCIDV